MVLSRVCVLVLNLYCISDPKSSSLLSALLLLWKDEEETIYIQTHWKPNQNLANWIAPKENCEITLDINMNVTKYLMLWIYKFKCV